MRHISWRLWALTILSGVLQTLCFPIAGPVPAWRAAFCWFALVPLFVALMSSSESGHPLRTRCGFLLGYLCGILWYLGNCYWIYATMHTYGGIAQPAAAGILFLFSLYLGLYHGIFGAIFSIIYRRGGRQTVLVSAPFIWVAVELARARITGFPWDLLGVAQIDNAVLTRVAPYAGAYGLSFAIVAVNALWLTRLTIRQRRHTRALLISTASAILLFYAAAWRNLQIRGKEPTSAVATLVQENLKVGAEAGPQMGRAEMLEAFSALSLFPPTLEACDGIPEVSSTRCGAPSSSQKGESSATYLAPIDLIVWPEAPNDFSEADPEFRNSISRLARAARAPVIAGSFGVTPDRAVTRGYDLYNSATFISPDGKFAGRYDKMHLVPFGEYVPYKKLFFFAGNLLQEVGVLNPGKKRVVFTSAGHTYGTFICYESVFGNEVAEYARMGAEVLVNISDDGWYGDTSAAWEHLNQVRMRAIENHRWILRATNTGVTAAIDPYGLVTSAIPRHIRSSLRAGFNYEHDVTFYAAHGDLFAWLCVVVTLATLGRGLLANRGRT